MEGGPDGEKNTIPLLVTEYGYDKDRNLSGLHITFCDELLTDNSYTYDGNGNQVTQQTISGLTSYRYDAPGRLASVEYPDRLVQFLYSGEELEAERDEEEKVTRYI